MTKEARFMFGGLLPHWWFRNLGNRSFDSVPWGNAQTAHLTNPKTWVACPSFKELCECCLPSVRFPRRLSLQPLST